MNTEAAQVGASTLHEIEVVHTRVFAASPKGGNPCPVIPQADRLTQAQMQGLARRFGLDTVFILNTSSKTTNIRLRYFVPDHEMGVSGHATIAAITVARLKNRLRFDHMRVETITGTFEVRAVQQNESPLVTLDQNTPVFARMVEPGAVGLR
jgi:PhzF family phenazine biosynthesis protein